jgi:hypothetical protein
MARKDGPKIGDKMKVISRKAPDFRRFSDIRVGSAFLKNDTLYMKVEPANGDYSDVLGTMFNSVHLIMGLLCFFPENEEVELVDAEVTFK